MKFHCRLLRFALAIVSHCLFNEFFDILVYLLNKPERLYLWIGSGAIEAEKKEAAKFCTQFERSPTQIAEGEEPAHFYRALNGAGRYADNNGWLRAYHDVSPRLFVVSSINVMEPNKNPKINVIDY